MPKPSAIGSDVCARMRRTSASAPEATRSRAPVTPSREMPYRNPLPSSAAFSNPRVGRRRAQQKDRIEAGRRQRRRGTPPASSIGRSSASTPSTPAAAARCAKASDAHPQQRVRVAEDDDRRRDRPAARSAIIASAARRLPPAASARSVARWMTGPSASGSENGTPTSMTSAPARSSAFRISAERGRSGSPAVVYVIRPVRPRRAQSCETSRRDGSSGSGSPTSSAFSTVLTSLSPRPDRLTSRIASAQRLRDALGVGDRVRRFQRRQDAFEPRQRLEGVERLRHR